MACVTLFIVRATGHRLFLIIIELCENQFEALRIQFRSTAVDNNKRSHKTTHTHTRVDTQYNPSSIRRAVVYPFLILYSDKDNALALLIV